MSVTSGKKKASVRKETVAVSRHETKDRGKMDVAPQACDEQAAADSLCKHLWVSEWHTQGKKGELTSCRGTVQSAWQKPPVRRKEEELSCPHALIRTGKAGENGQHSGEMGGSSPWTPPSAPECGHTLKAPAGDQRSINCGDRPRRRLRDPLGHRPVVLLRTETAR